MDRARARSRSVTLASRFRNVTLASRSRNVTLARIALAGSFAAGAVLLLSGATSAARAYPLRVLRWTDPSAWTEAASRQPPECLAQPASIRERDAIEVGRAAFRTPLLLGGQGARLGLSCESCHSNGRSNAAFRFAGLSGAPGTADVTSSMMSSHRGNSVFDPKPIPDLALPGKVNRSPTSPALRTFVHGLITEEFDGREPPATVLDGLVAYVRAIGGAHCAANTTEPVVAARWIDDANRAMAAARERWQAGDRAASVIMLGAARHALGRLDERYAGKPQDHAALATADAAIARIREDVEAGGRQTERRMLAWSADASQWQPRLRRDEPQSLFDQTRLARAIAQALPNEQMAR